MHAKLMIDRHFLILRGGDLAVFAERILRATHRNPDLARPDALWHHLNETVHELRQAIEEPRLRGKARQAAQRIHEARVRQALAAVADYVEAEASCKYDLFTAGFCAMSDKRAKDAPPSRRMRRRQEAVVRIRESAPQISSGPSPTQSSMT